MIDIGTAKFDRLKSLKQSLRQSLRQNQWDSNTRYRDSKRWEKDIAEIAGAFEVFIKPPLSNCLLNLDTFRYFERPRVFHLLTKFFCCLHINESFNIAESAHYCQIVLT
jgi:hypothetical protein